MSLVRTRGIRQRSVSPRVAPHRQVQLRAPAQVFGPHVDLDDLHVVGEEGVVREVGAEQDQQVALVGGLVGGAVAEQPAHPDVVRVVVLDPLLAAQGVPDRGLDLPGELHDLGVRAPRAGAAEQGDLLRLVDHVDEAVDLGVAGAGRGPGGDEGGLGGLLGGGLVGDVAGEGDDADTGTADRVLDGAVQQPGHLLRTGDHLAVVAALAEQLVGVGLLEVAEADLAGRDVRGEGEDRGHGPVGVVQTVDEVEVAGPAGAGAGGEPAGDLCLGAGGEGGGLLVPDVDPVDGGVAAHRVDDGVEAVADHAVEALDSRAGQDVDELFRDVLFGHGSQVPLRCP